MSHLSDILPTEDLGFTLQGKWGDRGSYNSFEWPATRRGFTDGLAKIRLEMGSFAPEDLATPARFGFVDEVLLFAPKPLGSILTSGSQVGSFHLGVGHGHNIDGILAAQWDITVEVSNWHSAGPQVSGYSPRALRWLLSAMVSTLPAECRQL